MDLIDIFLKKMKDQLINIWAFQRVQLNGSDGKMTGDGRPGYELSFPPCRRNLTISSSACNRVRLHCLVNL